VLTTTPGELPGLRFGSGLFGGSEQKQAAAAAAAATVCHGAFSRESTGSTGCVSLLPASLPPVHKRPDADCISPTSGLAQEGSDHHMSHRHTCLPPVLCHTDHHMSHRHTCHTVTPAGMQFYSGGFLGDQEQTADAKDGATYPRFGGLCLEAQVRVEIRNGHCIIAQAVITHDHSCPLVVTYDHA
jgi:hypothetical protein